MKRSSEPSTADVKLYGVLVVLRWTRLVRLLKVGFTRDLRRRIGQLRREARLRFRSESVSVSFVKPANQMDERELLLAVARWPEVSRPPNTGSQEVVLL